jgi:superfamily II DNA or RNA helicase
MVEEVITSGAEPSYQVFFGSTEAPIYPEHALLDADAERVSRDPVEQLRLWGFAPAEQFRSFLTFEKLNQPLASTVYSYLASRTRLLEYQFKPALKILDNPYSRILIADEVGLGKTIEAGIILTELHARQSLNRVLITCPSALRLKWRDEMRRRFDWDFDVLAGEELRRRLADSLARPGRPLRIIASLEGLRSAKTLEMLQTERLDFDAVIVDEAHHMRNRGTRTNELGQHLSDVTDTLVFLTATPLNLGEQDFFELMRLLVPEEFAEFADFETQIAPNEHLNAAVRALRSIPPDVPVASAELERAGHSGASRRLDRDFRYVDARTMLESAAARGSVNVEESVTIQRHLQEINTLAHVFTRTKKREVSDLFPMRRADPVSVTFSEPEQEFYDAVSEWVRLANRRHGIGAGTFVLIMFQRQLASCLPAMAAKLKDSLLGKAIAFEADDIAEHLDLNPGELLSAEDAAANLAMEERDLPLLDRLQVAWRAAQGVDSKYDAFAEALAQLFGAGQRKVIVFSFFIRTIEYLEQRLESFEFDGGPLEVLKLYGPTPADERADVVRRFQDTDARAVLLSSELGSEGLDFQFCSAMFNYDLPWNPMRVEQRIGRIDRYGQESNFVQILNLVVPTTVEGRIFYRLYDRIGIFERSVGDLEAILGDRDLERDLSSLTREIVFGSLTANEERKRTDLIAQAMARRQQDHETFDQESQRFLGTDDVFRQRFHDIEQGERYLHPTEIRNFVASFMSQVATTLEMRENPKRPAVFSWSGRGIEALDEAVRQHLTTSGETTDLDWQLAGRLCRDTRAVFTFNGEVATADHTVEFVSAHHPIVRAASAAFQAIDPPPAAGWLCTEATGATPGIYVFYIFRIQISGARSSLELEPVALEVDGTVASDVTDRLMPLITRAKANDRNPQGIVDAEFVARTHDAAVRWIEARRAAREADLRRLADARIDAQLQSLDLGYTRRVARIDTRLEHEHHPNMVRLLTGQRRNLDRRHGRKRHEIESRRDVAVGYDTVAAGILEVVEPPVSSTEASRE